MRQTREGGACRGQKDWSIRLLIVALAGILFLTLYPFEMGAHAKGIGHASPFLLGHGAKGNGARDIILNILLFVPFGFALGIKLRKRFSSSGAALLYTWLAGLFLSYTIELLQLYIPQRDSGWQDVITNSTGSAVGFVLSILVGRWLLKALSDFEQTLQGWLTMRRAGLVVLIYFAAWFAASVTLQKEAHLQDWTSDCRLVVGNDASGWHPWKGQVSLVEIWDRALPAAVVSAMMRGGEVPSATAPLIKLEFPAAPQGQSGVGADAASSSMGRPELETTGRSAGKAPLNAANESGSGVVPALKGANQFSIRVVLRRPDGEDVNGSIVSISHNSGLRDLYFREEGRDLLFWFRTPLTERRPALEWPIPRPLPSDRFYDLLISYDGSEVRFYSDGRRPRHDAMGPGTALASYVRHIKQSELNGYAYIYYAIVFLPGGILLGITFSKQSWRQVSSFAIVAAVVILAPAVLEWILVRVNGRNFSPGNFGLSAAMVVLGLLWMNSDKRLMPAQREREQRLLL